MVQVDQSAGHTLARAKRMGSGEHRLGPATATTYRVYFPTTPWGCWMPLSSGVRPPLLGSLVGWGVGK